MRKKMLFLALALAATAGSLTTSRAVAANHACQICTTYPDHSQCCRSCVCNDAGVPLGCTQNFCPPAP